MNEALAAVLETVECPGDFCVSGAFEAPLLHVEVDPIGVLAFPLQEVQARQLIEVAELAPYGRGADTIVDTAVRNAWQVSPSRVRLKGTAWQQAEARILSAVKRGLGCDDARVEMQFYKLLLYQVGSFFVSHRDSEKVDGMFATVVVVLPSLYRGGELIVSHAGRQVSMTLGGDELSELSFAAFYADCQHELRPITGGYRLALVFNLVRSGPDRITAPDYRPQIGSAERLLRAWSASDDGPTKLVYPLAHQYSQAGLSASDLKGEDAAVTSVLLEAARRSDCEASLGIVSLVESGSAELAGPYYPRRSRRWWGPREATEMIGSEYEVIEILERIQQIEHWRSLDDRPVDFGVIPFDDDELCPPGTLAGEAPDEDRVMEATGNEGASFERAYRRAAVVVWPRRRRMAIVAQAGPGATLPFLGTLLDEARTAGAGGDAMRCAAELAQHIVEHYDDNVDRLGSRDVPLPRVRLLELLLRLDDTTLAERFFQETIIHRYDGRDNAAIIVLCERLDEQRAAQLLAPLIANQMEQHHGGCVALLSGLTHGLEDQRSSEALCVKVGRAVVEGLPTKRGLGFHRAPSPDAHFVRMLFTTLVRVGDRALLDDALGLCLAHPQAYLPDEVLLPVVLGMVGGSADLERGKPWYRALWQNVTDFLTLRSATAPVKPKDWARDGKLTRNCVCENCRALQAFLRDPERDVFTYKAAKEHRAHLESQCHGLDVTCSTLRSGSPHSLVCRLSRCSTGSIPFSS
ncbi:MAG: 2OG-Fe(II) oxygenase [Deltaproteobacteria bacterium]|nr:2OG-Fe(II) oxygenase [Deltaproteobacteria bacterium]